MAAGAPRPGPTNRRWLAIVVGAAIATLGACGGGQGIPPNDAPPLAVLTAYLHALKAGDCATARTLGTSSFATDGDLCGIAVMAVGPVDSPAIVGPDDVEYSTILTLHGGDSSLPDGDHLWFYELKRRPDGSWRIVGGGSGP